MNALNNDEEREKDIQSVCLAVVNAVPIIYYNPNGADETTCPFCIKRVYWADAEMKDIDHDINCAYNIAKDLLTKRK